jgi:hypothetical protein
MPGPQAAPTAAPVCAGNRPTAALSAECRARSPSKQAPPATTTAVGGGQLRTCRDHAAATLDPACK